MRARRVALAVAAASFLGLLATGPQAALAKPGDLYVLDSGFGASDDRVALLRPGAPPSTIVADAFGNPQAIAIARNGTLYVTDRDLPMTSAGAVFRLSPRTGSVQLLASGPLLVHPEGIAVGPDRMLYVTDEGGGAPVLRVDPASGDVTEVVPEPSPFGSPEGIDIAPNGALLVSDVDGFLYRVNPATGDFATIADAPELASPSGIARAADGTIYLADEEGGGSIIRRVNPVSGAVSDVLASPPLDDVFGLAMRANGRLAVPDDDPGANGSVLSVNPRNASFSTLFSGTELPDPVDVAVAPPRCGGKNATVVGSPGRDRLRGSRFRDMIVGLGGRDRINGLGGRDLLCGGKGRDRLTGGKARDTLLGGPGDDLCLGSGDRKRAC